jgi:hypothetical protein
LRRFLEKNPDICNKFNIKLNEAAELEEKSELKSLIIPSAPVIPTKRPNDPKRAQPVAEPKKTATTVTAKTATPAATFDEADKYDFPSLFGKPINNQPAESKPAHDYPSLIAPADQDANKKRSAGLVFTNNSWGNVNNPFLYTAQENQLNLKKKLAEEFPSLAPSSGPTPAGPTLSEFSFNHRN